MEWPSKIKLLSNLYLYIMYWIILQLYIHKQPNEWNIYVSFCLHQNCHKTTDYLANNSGWHNLSHSITNILSIQTGTKSGGLDLHTLMVQWITWSTSMSILPHFCSQQHIGWNTYTMDASLKQWTHYVTINHPNLDPTKILTKWSTCIIWTHILNYGHPRMMTTTHWQSNSHPKWCPTYMAYMQPEILKTKCLHKEELLTKPKPYNQNWIQTSKN